MARTKIPRGSVEEEGLFYFDHEPYQDRGCPDGKHPSCFNCPLEVCRYEAESPARRMRDERIVSAVDAGADINAVAAEQGVSRRTVFRVRAAEGRAAVTAQQAELGDAFERLGAMTLRTLRVELSEVTSAQEALASAGVRLAEARARVSGRVSQLLVSLSALGVELPADVRSAVGELASSKGERLKRAKVPCPECGKECEEGRGMANHRRVMHGVTLTNAGRGGSRCGCTCRANS